MRVIGSHAIFTTSGSPPCTLVIASPRLLEAGGQLVTRRAPARLALEGVDGEAAQLAHGGAVRRDAAARQGGPRRLLHERHELVGEARHRAADADAAHVGAPADPVDPATLRHVALHHRPPAAELDDALAGAVGPGEVGL